MMKNIFDNDIEDMLIFWVTTRFFEFPFGMVSVLSYSLDVGKRWLSVNFLERETIGKGEQNAR